MVSVGTSDGLKPTHPGEIMGKDVLPALNMTIELAAKEMRLRKLRLEKIIAGEAPVTVDVALRFGKFCGNGPTLWINLQTAYDLWNKERELKDVLSRIATYSFPRT